MSISPSSPHQFHIPVMGLAFTIDTPAKVARFGIASALSIVEDQLIETMRSYYYPLIGQPYVPIPAAQKDYRASRITDYLNLLNQMVLDQVEQLKKSAFEAGSEITQYFEMLPEESAIKQLYRFVINKPQDPERNKAESYLRSQIHPGRIDVNIMTKIDRNHYEQDGRIIEEGSDAVTAVRAYAESELSNSAVIFSAGMNPRLYNYLEKCPAFDADDQGAFKKKIVIKVSDFRSALIQGKYLAKRGIWVSEFRIESGLNCGGHAFATEGLLMGPILEEFKSKKQELIDSLFELYNQAIQAKGHRGFTVPHELKISAQGGIGTYEENRLLHSYYGLDSTGWGTPFLLVPEATTVDDATLKLLCKAREGDVALSHHSPLGVRFHYLKNTSSDEEKNCRIGDGRPGSPCTEQFLVYNTEFTEKPICTASRKYQKLKIEQLQSMDLTPEAYQSQFEEVVAKECLCIGLSNAASKVYGVPFVKNLHAVSICPGPNIVHFSKIVDLQTMTDHIYGRTNIIEDPQRPHMFIAELKLYLSYLNEQLQLHCGKEPERKMKKYFEEFCSNLNEAIHYYRQLPPELFSDRKTFIDSLNAAALELSEIRFPWADGEPAQAQPSHSLLHTA